MGVVDGPQQPTQAALALFRVLVQAAPAGREMRDVEFRMIKITLPGPFTMSRQAKNEFYKDEEELVMDYAAAVNAELWPRVR